VKAFEESGSGAAAEPSSVGELATYLGGEVVGDPGRRIDGAASAESAGPSQITFALDQRTLETAAGAGCVVIPPGLQAGAGRTCIRVPQPKLAFVKLLERMWPAVAPEPGIDPQAQVHRSARLGSGVRIEAFAVIEAEAQIGAGSVLGCGAVVGRGNRVGEQCRIYPRVVLYPGVTLQDRVIVHAGVVIGSDGFGYVSDGVQARKFPQLGTVVIESDVEIGANSTIDRGALGETRIGRGTKLDNLVQIGHNVRIGRHCLVAAQTGIGGSAVVGDGVIIAGQVGIADHARIGDGVTLGGKSGVPAGRFLTRGVYWGVPARPLDEVKRQLAALALLAKRRGERGRAAK